MKESPIIFSTPMVQAILEGRKTQTRRVIRQQYDKRLTQLFKGHGNKWQLPLSEGSNWFEKVNVKCPYGQIGDKLWVRETWVEYYDPHGHPFTPLFAYKADSNASPAKWKPSIHMPRSASRIILEVTDIRVERLQDISEEDAIAEGSYLNRCSCYPAPRNRTDSIIDTMMKQTWCHQHGDEFKALWDSINAKKHPWDSNPWGWVIEFKRI